MRRLTGLTRRKGGWALMWALADGQPVLLRPTGSFRWAFSRSTRTSPTPQPARRCRACGRCRSGAALRRRAAAPLSSNALSTLESAYADDSWDVPTAPYDRDDLQRIGSRLVQDQVISHRPEQDGTSLRQVFALVPRAGIATQGLKCAHELSEDLPGNSVRSLLPVVVPNLEKVLLSSRRENVAAHPALRVASRESRSSIRPCMKGSPSTVSPC